MNNNLDDIKKKMSALKDDELRKIIYLHSIDYAEEAVAVAVAKDELFGRYNENIWESENVTLAKLLKLSNIAEIEESILKLYPDSDKKLSKYTELLTELSRIQAGGGTGDYISVEKSENEINQESWEVYGIDKSTGERFGLEYCGHEEWLSFIIKKEQLQTIGKEDYIAYCIMTMTSMASMKKK